MFCKQLWCNIMIDGNIFKVNIHVRKVNGSECMNFYGMLGEFPEWYIDVKIICNTDVKIISKKLSRKFHAHGTFCLPPLPGGGTGTALGWM